jgi:hypothetical protein
MFNRLSAFLARYGCGLLEALGVLGRGVPPNCSCFCMVRNLSWEQINRKTGRPLASRGTDYHVSNGHNAATLRFTDVREAWKIGRSAGSFRIAPHWYRKAPRTSTGGWSCNPRRIAASSSSLKGKRSPRSDMTPIVTGSLSNSGTVQGVKGDKIAHEPVKRLQTHLNPRPSRLPSLSASQPCVEFCCFSKMKA